MPAFLDILELTSDNPEGKGFNNSTRFVGAGDQRVKKINGCRSCFNDSKG